MKPGDKVICTSSDRKSYDQAEPSLDGFVVVGEFPVEGELYVVSEVQKVMDSVVGIRLLGIQIYHINGVEVFWKTHTFKLFRKQFEGKKK